MCDEQIETLASAQERSLMDDEQINKLSDVIRETGFAIHAFHRHGHLEKIYENALTHRLRKLGLKVDSNVQYLCSMKTEHFRKLFR